MNDAVLQSIRERNNRAFAYQRTWEDGFVCTDDDVRDLLQEVDRLREQVTQIEADAASLRRAFYDATEAFQKQPTQGMSPHIVEIWKTLYEAVRDHKAGLGANGKDKKTPVKGPRREGESI